MSLFPAQANTTMKKLFRFIYLFIGLLICMLPVSAQLLPVNQPEQNACGALVLCGTSFTSPYSYQGIGTVTDLSTTPCGSGEDNSVWLKLTVSTSGSLVFNLSPVSPQDDYDFAVLNMTNTTCSNLSSANVVRCNFNNNNPGSNVNGVIGLNSSSLLQYVAGGTTGSSFCQQINAVAGQVYLIMINNFGNYSTGGPSSGFTISFSGSTATFNSPPPPHFESINTPICNYKNEITIKLTSEVKCNSIAANGSDFYLSPSGTIVSATGINCSGTQGYTDKVKLTFSPALAPGNYVVHAQQGTDGNTLLDLCNNPLPLPDQLSFRVPDLAKTVTMTKCANQLPFVWNGINVTAGGATAAVAHHTTADGCDSATTLNLTIVPQYNTTVSMTKCTNQLPFVWNGITVTAGGSAAAVYHTTTAAGCDSNVTLNLTVNIALNTTVNQTICTNQLPYTWNGITVTTGGAAAAVFHTTAISGCDSSVTLNLTVTPVKTNTVTLTKCTNQLPFIWNGMTIPAGSVTNPAAAVFNALTAAGCDSIVTLSLLVNPVKNHTVFDTLCSNQLPLVWNGITVSIGGTAAAVYNTVSAANCDSIVTLNLTVKSSSSLLVKDTICQNELPYSWNGITVTTGGVSAATYTVNNANGCDSVVTLSLYVRPVIHHTVSITRCASQMPYSWNGITVTTGGPVAAQFTAPAALTGCDSITTLNLTVQSPVMVVSSISGCGQVVFEGNSYAASQLVKDTFISVAGCDSVYRTVTITVYPQNPVTINKDTFGCGSLLFEGNTYTQSITVTDTISGIHGCDSVYNVTHITIYPNNPALLVIDTAACDRLIFENKIYSQDTILINTYKNVLGCDSVLRTVNIHVEHFELELTAQPQEIVKGENVQLTTTGNVNYQVNAWLPAALFPNQLASGQNIKPDYSQTFIVIARSDLGCIDTAMTEVKVDTLIPDLFIPNAFSPNGDGLNDNFGAQFFNKSGYQIVDFRIFNRWGQLVYVVLHKKESGWDGTYNGKPADAGVYYYYIKARFVNGKTLDRKGEVTLIR